MLENTCAECYIKARHFFCYMHLGTTAEKDNPKYIILNFGLRGYWHFCIFNNNSLNFLTKNWNNSHSRVGKFYRQTLQMMKTKYNFK